MKSDWNSDRAIESRQCVRDCGDTVPIIFRDEKHIYQEEADMHVVATMASWAITDRYNLCST